MFERNKIDNSLQQMAVPAEITLDDGTLLKGKFLILAARSISEVLNGDTRFFEFETYSGERSLLARSAIKAIKLINIPGIANFRSRIKDGDTFDPYQTLGVSSDTVWEDIRAQYLKLSKTYHPDRFSGLDLPSEVREYLSAMARRVNAAYAALEEPVIAAKRATIAKAQPVYTSAQRF